MSKDLNSRSRKVIQRPKKHETDMAAYPTILIKMALEKILQCTPIV